MADNMFPADVNANAIAAWLSELGGLPQVQAAHQLHHALKELKSAPIAPEQLLQTLQQLSPLTLHFCHNLPAAALAEPLQNGKALKLAKLILQLPKQMSLLLCQLIESKSLSAATSGQAVYYALQMIGHALRCHALCRETPSTTLWKKTAFLYRHSVADPVFKQIQTSKIPEFKPQSTIESVLKRNLLFSLFTHQALCAEETEAAFGLAGQLAELLQISPQRQNDTIFYWEVDKIYAPMLLPHPRKPVSFSAVFLEVQRLGQELQLGTMHTRLSTASLNRLALAFTGHRKVFNAIVPGPPLPSRLIGGFADICNFVQELNKLLRIMDLSAQLRNDDARSYGYSLVPLEHQRSTFAMPPNLLQKQQGGRQVNVMKTTSGAYLIAENRNLDFRTGDLGLLYREQHPLTLSIIRQQVDNQNACQLLLEPIPGTCTCYPIAGNSHALLIGEQGPNPQVFLHGGKYAVGDEIQFSLGPKIRLTACLESTPYYSRFNCQFPAPG
ncbi:hypothetical protein [Methylomonas rhizoryzae]|uniref:hypothetical protein n=1 Tax=Methylomonas rhizoryzae TaxID=2608981 RepID=UPI001232C6C9|nr:hypothetical protein [Methylomonas rhizoryzae]